MKRSLHRILCFLLVILMIPIFSMTALAADDGVVLKATHFDIALQEDGSAYVTETKEFAYSGDREFTRYVFNNFFAGPRVFSDWQVSIDGTPLSQLDEPDNDNRPENTFAVENGDGENNIYIYYRQKDSGTRVFEISYRVENAVKLYSDVAEFSWNLTSKNGDVSDVSRLTATLIVPEVSVAEDFRIWAHGPLNGTFLKQPDGSAVLEIDNVAFGTLVDIRSTLPADCFTGGWEQEGEGLDKILAEEKELADSANAKREEEERAQAEREAYWEEYWAKRNAWEAEHPVLNSIEGFCSKICDSISEFLIAGYDGTTWELTNNAAYVIAIVIFAVPFLWITGVFRTIKRIRHKRLKKKLKNVPAQSPQYYRNLPDDRPAPAVDRLLHFYDGKSSLSRQLSSTLLELNLKNLLHFRVESGNTMLLLNEQLGEQLFSSSETEENAEAVPEPQQDQKAERIPEHQKILWEFLWKAAGGNGSISMSDLKKYIKENLRVSLDFRKSFEGAVESEYSERVKFTDVEKYSSGRWKLHLIISAITGCISMVISMLSTLYDGIQFVASLKIGLITFVIAFIILSLFRFAVKRTKAPCWILDQQSEDDLALWNAFGRFLDNFTTFEDKELPEFSVWREYMVYAVAMGKGKKIAQALALKYPEAFSAQSSSSDDDLYRMLQDTALYDAMDSIGRDVAEAREPSSSGSGSWNDGGDSWSDGDGGGGGFSDSGGGSDSGSGGGFMD